CPRPGPTVWPAGPSAAPGSGRRWPARTSAPASASTAPPFAWPAWPSPRTARRSGPCPSAAAAPPGAAAPCPAAPTPSPPSPTPAPPAPASAWSWLLRLHGKRDRLHRLRPLAQGLAQLLQRRRPQRLLDASPVHRPVDDRVHAPLVRLPDA